MTRTATLLLLAGHATSALAGGTIRSFLDDVFDPTSASYVGKQSGLAAAAFGSFVDGTADTGLTGVVYPFGEEPMTTSFGIDTTDLPSTGFPSDVTMFQSSAELTTPTPLSEIVPSLTLEQRQLAELTSSAPTTQTFQSEAQSQALFQAVGSGPQTLEVSLAFASVINQAGSIAAGETLLLQLLRFDGDTAETLIEVDGFYQVTEAGVLADFVMLDAQANFVDITSNFAYTPGAGPGDPGEAEFAYSMQFDATPGVVYGLNLASDVSLDTFGEAQAMLDSQTSPAAAGVTVVTPGGGLVVNGVIAAIPEPGSAALLVASLVVGARRRMPTRPRFG